MMNFNLRADPVDVWQTVLLAICLTVLFLVRLFAGNNVFADLRLHGHVSLCLLRL